MNSERFYFRRFLKNQAPQVPARKRLLETLEDRVFYDAAPVVTVDAAPATSGTQAAAKPLISEEFQFTATFDNAGNADGYGPFVDVKIDKGIDLVGAPKYLGATLQVAGGVDNSNGATAVTYEHIYTKELITVAAGQEYWVYDLPFGSFVPDQPKADLTFTAVTDKTEGAIVGTGMNISVRGGFRFGADPLDNPQTDPVITGPLSVAVITPSVWSVSKDLIEHENETATGENFPNTWEIYIDVAQGETLTNVTLKDILPNNVHFVAGSLTINGATFSAQNVPDAANYAGGILDLSIASIVGVAGRDITISYQTYTPQFTSTGDVNGNNIKDAGDYVATTTPVINPTTGASNSSTNGVNATAQYNPGTGSITVTDLVGSIDDNVDSPNSDTLADRSLAIQKGVSVVGGGSLLPSVDLSYQLNFQVSDYFQFEGIKIVDTLSDGQLFDATQPVTFTWVEHGVTTTANFSLGSPTTTTNYSGATNLTKTSYANLTSYFNNSTTTQVVDGYTVKGGETVLVFMVSAQMATVADARAVGGRVNGAAFGGTTGTISYRTKVQENYINPTPGNPSIDLDDTITSGVSISGDVYSWAGAFTGSTAADGSGTTLTVPSPQLSKDVYAVGGVIGAVGAISPGETLSYKLSLDLPTSDIENLLVTDFLPLPKFLATELTSVQTISKTQFTSLGANYVPAAGKMVMVLADEVYDSKFGTGAHSSAINITTLAPTNGALAATILAYDNAAFSAGNGGGINATANSFSIFIGSYDVDASVGDEVAIYFTVTATDTPMADGLLLTNQMQATYGNTGGQSLVGQDIVQVIVEEPVLSIFKGVVSSTKGTGATAGGLTFANSGGTFTGTLTGATNAAAIGALNLTSGTLPDAGDSVGFAIVVQNTGRADAYDVTFSDVIAAYYVNNFATATAFVAATNLKVYDGAGVLQALGTDYTLTWNNTTKQFSISMVDTGGVGAVGAGKNTAGVDVTNGSNAIVVRYDLTLATGAQAGSTILNTAMLSNYAGIEGGIDHTAENLIESASVTVASPLIALTLVSSSVNEAGNNGTDQAVIGEIVTYTLTVTVPEGTMTNVKLQDVLPSGLAFQGITSISTSAGVTVGSLPTTGTTPANTTITNQGGNIAFNLGTVTNSNTNNAATETIQITYTAVVLNVVSNQAGTQLGNDASLSYDYTNVGTSTLAPTVAGGTGSLSTSAATTVKVVEPSVSVSNSISKDNVTYVDNATLTVIAGETVYYKVVLTNTGGLGAYDLSLYDRLPNVFNLATTSIVSVTSSAGVTDFSTANFAIVTDTAFGNNKPALVTDGALGGLAAGETITIIVKSNIVNDAVAASTHPNGIQVRWTSLDDNRRSVEATDSTPTPTAIDGSATPIVRSTYNTNAVERTGGEGPTGTLNNYASTDDLTATVFQVQPIAIVKAVVGTEINDSAGTNTNNANQAVVGEYVDYSVTFSVPRGVTTSFTVTDTMLAGLSFVGYVDVTVGSNITTNVNGANVATASSLDDTNTTAVNLTRLLAATTVGTNGQSFTINLGNVYNDQALGAGDTYVAPQQITITYRAIVTDVVGNQAGTQLNNTATINYTTTNDSVAGNVTASSTPAQTIAVIEPVLQLGNTWSPAGPYDSGDAVTSTLVISHAASSNTHAYDLTFSDALPTTLVKAGGAAFTSADLGTAITIIQSGGVGDISGQFEIVGGVLQTKAAADVDLLKGASITITINGVLSSTVQAAQGVTNSATVTWSSINGAPTVSSSYTTADTERDGSGGVNDYTTTTAASLTVASPTIDLSWKDGTLTVDDTSVASSTGADAVIGETVTFDILVTLPEGVSKNVRVEELLPAGLRYDSFQVITTAAGSSRLTDDFGGTVTGAPTVSGASADGSAASTVVFTFGDITTTNDNVAGNNSFVLRVTATVANVLVNQTGQTLSPTARVVINDTDGASNNGVAGDVTINDANAGNNPVVAIVEPTLTVTKGVSPSSGSIDAGDVLTYTITLTNTSGQTAYDVTLSDPISANLTVTAGFIGTVSGSSLGLTGGAAASANAFEIVNLGGGNFAVRSATGADVDIPTGGTVTLTFTATVVSTIGPAASITNTANVRWTSTDGTNTSERGGGDVSDTAPTSITQTQNTGALNNYALSSSIVTSVVNDIAIVKSVVTTSLGGNDGVVTPGEVVTYQMSITLPEGVTPDLQIRDALPAGMAYVPGSLVLVTTGFAGSVSAPTVNPQSGGVFDNGTDIVFDFASITTTNDNVTTNNTFTFTFQAVALDVVSNDGVLPGQTTLTTTATHNNGTGSTFNKSAGDVTVTVVEPALSVVNTLNITGVKDAGAPFSYTIVVSPTLNATTGAYEVRVADVLPAELGATSFTASISDGVTTTDVSANFALTGNTLSTTGTVNLLLNTNGTQDQVLTITISGSLSAYVNPGETVDTTTTLAYTSLPGDQTQAGGFNPNTDVTTDHERAYTGSDTESFTAATATFSKSLFSTSQAFTTGSNVAIGETVTYALLITLPEGTTPDLSVLDRLPAGLQYVSASVITTAAASGGLLTADFNGTLPAPTTTGGATDGADVQFTFGSIAVTGDNVTTNNAFVILVTARVTNVVGNQSGTTLGADATFDISGDGVAVTTSSTVNVNVVEPRVTVSKTVTSSVDGLDAGDSVTYQITINNLGTNGATADAFDVALSDVLPTGMLITAIGAPTLSGSATVDTALSGSGTNTLGGTFDIPLGGSVTFTVTAQIPNTVAPGQALTSDLNVVYSSLNGTDANERNGSNVTDPEDNTPPTVNATLNNYAVGADVTVTAANAFAVTKTLSDTSLGSDTSLNVVVGETLTYQLAVSVIEGTTSNLSLIDTLPRTGGVNQLVYVAGSFAVTNANGITINGLTASYDATTNQLTITATSVVNPGGSNATTNDASVVETDTFFITYQARVADVSANATGTTLTNDVDATATGVTADNNNAVTVTVRQPVLAIDKSFDVTTANAGDLVTVSVVLTNSGNAAGYDTVLSDTINGSVFDIGTVTAVTTPSGWTRAFNSTTGLVTYTADNTAVINAGDTVTFTFTAKLRADLAPGAGVSNTAGVITSTLPGTVTGERTLPSVTDTATLTVPSTLTLAKSLVGTDSTGTTGSNVTIGESATFRLLVTLGEGTTSVLTFSDTLPAGLAYQGGTAIFRATTAGATAVGAVSNTAYVDGAVINAADLVYNSSTGALTVSLKNVVIPATTANTTGQISLDYTAKVTDVVGNANGTTLTNSATVSADRNGDGDLVDVGETSATGTHTLTVTEPELTIAKDFDVTSADAGDVITTTIVITNTGSSSAYNTVISDTLNSAQFDLSTFTAGTLPSGWGAVFNSTTGALTVTDSNATGIAAGGTVTITFTAKLVSTLAPGTAVANTASVVTTSMSGTVTGERTTPAVTDNATLTSSSTLSLVKSVNATSETSTTGNNVAIGETVTFRLGVTLQQGVTSLVTLRDTLPGGLGYQAGTAIFRATTTGATAVGAVSGTVYSDGVAINAADLAYNTTTGVFTVSLSTVTIPSTASVGTGGFAIDYTTLVKNVLANSGDGTATTLVNSATVSADRNNDGDIVDVGETTTASTQTLTVVEPVLTFDQTALTPITGLDAGDTIQYQVTFTNTGTATAHDVTFADTLPAGVVITAIGTPTLTGGATTDTALSGLTTGAIGGEFTVPVGGSVTFTYTVTLQNTVTPTTDYTSAATLNWSSIDGTNTNERTGADGTQGGGTLNDYRLTDSVTASTASTFALDKTANKTTASIGEIITYSLQLTLNEGTTQNVVLTDTLPVVSGALQLVFVPGTAAITYGTTASSITGSVTPVVSGAQNQTLTFSLGDVVVPAGAGANSVTVTYQVRVANIVTNASGDVEVNSASGSATGVTSDTGNTASVTLTEPALSIDTSITSNTTNVDAGDTVTYQIVVTHLPTSTSGAFDLNLTDSLPGELQGYTIVSATIGATDVSSAFNVTGTSLTTTGNVDLALGQTLTITVSGKAKDANVPGTVVSNSATVGYTSQDGTVTGERSYSETDAAPDVITVGSLTVTKTADKTTATIGEVVTYTVTVTVAEGTTTVSLDDTLPTGLVLVANSGVLNTPTGWTITGFTNNNVDQTLTVTKPGAVDGAATLDTGSFTLTYQAVVTNVVGNQSGVTLTNTLNAAADLNNDGDTTDTGETDNNNQATVTITEPHLAITKTVNDTTPHLGDTITYTLVLTNDGTSGAFGVSLSDVLPTGVTIDPLTAITVTPAGSASVSTAVTANVANTALSGAFDIPVGGTITIVYQAVVSSDPAIVGGTFGGTDDVLAGVVAINWSSLSGTVTGERTGVDGEGPDATTLNNYANSLDTPITVVGADLSLMKDDGLTFVVPGQSWTYTLTVTNDGTDTATGVTLTETVPPETTITAIRIGGVDTAFTVVAGVITVSLADIPAGDNVVISIDATLDAAVDVGRETLANTASVTHDDVEATPLNNTSTDTNDLTAAPDIAVDKAVTSVNNGPVPLNGLGEPIVAAGDTMIYTIVLTNNGDQDSLINIVDSFPGIVLDLSQVVIDDSQTGVTAVVNIATNTITWSGVSLAAGQTITITLEAKAFNPQLQALDNFTNTVVVTNVNPANTSEDGTQWQDDAVTDLAATPDLVVTKVNSTNRIGLDDVFTYTITLSNAGDQNATNVTVVDSLPPYVQLISASGNYIYDPVARTITWLAVDNPALAVVDGGGAETLSFTVTVKLPINSIAFGDLTNTVRAFDDGTNGPDVNPLDNEASNTTEVLGFLYDSMQNFSTFSVFDRVGDDRPWYQLGQPIEVYRDAILPIAPIYSGSAEPGSTLEVVMQNANGDIIGRQTVMADTGGNWMASFPGAIVKDYPQSVMITQTPSNTQTESSQGYNMRPYYATAVNAGHFFKQSLNVTRLLGDTASATTAALEEANTNPIGFSTSGSPYEVLASPGQPSGR